MSGISPSFLTACVMTEVDMSLALTTSQPRVWSCCIDQCMLSLTGIPHAISQCWARQHSRFHSGLSTTHESAQTVHESLTDIFGR